LIRHRLPDRPCAARTRPDHSRRAWSPIRFSDRSRWLPKSDSCHRGSRQSKEDDFDKHRCASLAEAVWFALYLARTKEVASVSEGRSQRTENRILVSVFTLPQLPSTDQLPRVLHSINFLNLLIAANCFDPREPESESARMAVARLHRIKSDL